MTQRFKRLSHSIYECKYHVVFCPKYRYQIFKDQIGEYTKQQIYRLCQQKELVEVLELNVQADHVHLLAMVPLKVSISGYLGTIKGRTAIRILSKYKTLRQKPYWVNHFWSRKIS